MAMGQDLQDKLNRLEELIFKERDCARSLKVEQLRELQLHKGELIKEIGSATKTCPDEFKPLVKKLRHENIRNAKLLHTCLNNLRQMMRHCVRQLSPHSYGNRGNKIESAACGMLLNGKV